MTCTNPKRRHAPTRVAKAAGGGGWVVRASIRWHLTCVGRNVVDIRRLHQCIARLCSLVNATYAPYVHGWCNAGGSSLASQAETTSIFHSPRSAACDGRCLGHNCTKTQQSSSLSHASLTTMHLDISHARKPFSSTCTCHQSTRNVTQYNAQYNLIAKCQYTDCTRYVLCCQVHSSHSHSTHKTCNYNNSK